MRASGSNSVRIENLRVPEHHVAFLSAGLSSGPESMVNGTPGTRQHGNPIYLGRLAAPYHCSLVVPIVGAARAALDEYEDIITTRKTLSLPQVPRFEHFDFQRPFGHALTLTDAAEALLIRVARCTREFPALGRSGNADHDRGKHAAVGHDPARRPHGLRSGRAPVPHRRLGGRAKRQPPATIFQ